MTTSKKIASVIGALIVGLVVGYGYFHRAPTTAAIPAESPKRAGGGETVDYQPVIYVNGHTDGDEFISNKLISMRPGSNQASWQNTFGRVVYISNVIVKPVATSTSATTITASSTLLLSVGTSTAATVTNSNSTPVFGSLIDSLSIATSTNLTNTAYNNIKDGGTNGRAVIPVQPGQYVIATLYSTNYGVNPSCEGGKCETATSTNRGYNLNFLIKYTY